MNPIAQLDRLLREHNFMLIRQDKHQLYKNPDNKIFVTSSTPSDFRWAKNALANLKHVIASPAKPMVLAISDFEREQAATLISGQQKPAVGISGAGKNKRSRGTGFIYEDQDSPLTPEQEAARLAEKLRREAKQAERRERKLQREAELQAARIQWQQEKELIERHLDAYTDEFMSDWEHLIDSQAAFFIKNMRALLKHKFATNKQSRQLSASSTTKKARAWITSLVKDARERGATTLEEIDERLAIETAFWLECIESHIPSSVAKAKRIITSLARKSIHLVHQDDAEGFVLDADKFLNRLLKKVEEVGEDGTVNHYTSRLLDFFGSTFEDELLRAQEAQDLAQGR